MWQASALPVTGGVAHVHRALALPLRAARQGTPAHSPRCSALSLAADGRSARRRAEAARARRRAARAHRAVQRPARIHDAVRAPRAGGADARDQRVSVRGDRGGPRVSAARSTSTSATRSWRSGTRRSTSRIMPSSPAARRCASSEKVDERQPTAGAARDCRHSWPASASTPVRARSATSGRRARFDYSAVGDAVNVASRLEGETKNVGSSILLGPETRRARAEFRDHPARAHPAARSRGIARGVRAGRCRERGRGRYQAVSRSAVALILWIDRSAPLNSSSGSRRKPIVALSAP